jgi:hypothetical protein
MTNADEVVEKVFGKEPFPGRLIAVDFLKAALLSGVLVPRCEHDWSGCRTKEGKIYLECSKCCEEILAEINEGEGK